MSDKKHIDRIFQEKFKDFEVAPNDSVWENIQSKLNESENQKDTKPRPIWWRYASVAALLLLLLAIGNFVLEDKNRKNVPSTDILNTENSSSEQPSKNTEKTPSTVLDRYNNGENSNRISDINTSNLETSPNNANQGPNSSNNIIISNTIPNEPNNKQKNSIASERTNSKIVNPNLVVESNLVNQKNSFDKNVLVDNVSENQTPQKTDLNTIKISSPSKNNSAILNTDSQNIFQNLNSGITNTSEKGKNNLKYNDAILGEAEVDQIISRIKENGVALGQQGGINASELNLEGLVIDLLLIDEEMASLEDIIEEEKLINRWSVSPNVAPVYFNTLGNGSSLDVQFNDNTKQGELNMSYGILGSYAINNKLIVRAGMNKVDLGYNTNDVIILETIGQAPNSTLLKNISSSNIGGQMSIINARALSVEEAPSSLNVEEDLGSINQRIGYIEVPIELQYNLLNKKIGLCVIGGFSTLFLNQNELHSEIDGSRTFIGEANNINRVSYSANFGLGLNYNLSKEFNFKLEPIFKYQLNTFSNTSGNFNPYFIGVYTGFSFKF